jgi:hypothetical protein
MKVNFFEEYPTDENMSKLDRVDWKSLVLIAAPSLNEFKSIQETYTSRYPLITFGWWPTIPGSYWVSGFSNTEDLKKLLNELTNKKQEKELSVLIDLELPFKSPIYFKNIFNLKKNKRLIEEFLIKAPEFNLKIYTAEYPKMNDFMCWAWTKLGISPPFKFSHTKLPMVYSSILLKSFGKYIFRRVKKFESIYARKNPSRVGFGLGTIAIGILENEPILSSKQLKEDLEWAQSTGVEEVFIYRLGGLNNEYLDQIKSLIFFQADRNY